MNEKIEKLGSFISGYVPDHPNAASKMLEISYRAVGAQATHFPSKQYTKAREYLQGYTATLLADMLKDPRRAAVVNIFMPSEIFCALGMPIMAPEALATYVVNTACERVFIDTAEERGSSESLCSYHKVLTGMAETGVMKKPSMVANTTLACDANQLTFRRLADAWQVPHVTIDVPYTIDDDAVHYVANQLRGMGRVAEEASGRKLDAEVLAGCVAKSRDQLRHYAKYLKYRKYVHLPESLTPEMLTVAANHLYLGNDAGLLYSRKLLADLKTAERHTTEKRILWMHVLPNWQESIKGIFQGNENHRVEVVGCDLAASTLYEMSPEDMDPGHPYEAMAKRVVYDSFNGPGERRIDACLNLARELQADGILIFCQWGCKQTQGLAMRAKNVFEEHGIPAIVLDGDGCDRANGGGEQIVTRAEAFVEQLEGAG